MFFLCRRETGLRRKCFFVSSCHFQILRCWTHFPAILVFIGQSSNTSKTTFLFNKGECWGTLATPLIYCVLLALSTVLLLFRLNFHQFYDEDESIEQLFDTYSIFFYKCTKDYRRTYLLLEIRDFRSSWNENPQALGIMWWWRPPTYWWRWRPSRLPQNTKEYWRAHLQEEGHWRCEVRNGKEWRLCHQTVIRTTSGWSPQKLRVSFLSKTY